jgi:formylglycine-generating enzyme required for sulfatase activity
MKRTITMSLRGAACPERSEGFFGMSSRLSYGTKQSPRIKVWFRAIALIMTLVIMTSCAPVEPNAHVPAYETGVDPAAWVTIPAGTFYHGQAAELEKIDYAYEIMVTDVTVTQYVTFLNAALSDGTLKVDGRKVVGTYPGDEFHAFKHEIEIKFGDYIFVPLNDPASRFSFNETSFAAIPGWEAHPMTNVSWFGARGYCLYYNSRLPTELEWEKAARGSTDDRPFPWGNEISRNNANFYASRDPFEKMSTFGSRTSPVGFYNGKTYDGYVTLDSASPFGLYDMAGDVWQWVGDITPDFSDRFMHGGSKDTYDMDLRVWVRNSAPPIYYSPGVGFRCVK